jgi:hypothetical protein
MAPTRAWSRRTLLLMAPAILAGVAALAAPAASFAADGAPIRIGIIGAGHIGGTLARLWVQSGHEVMISSRHPDELKSLAQSLGPKARVGTVREAARFGDAVLIAIPYASLPQLGQQLGPLLTGKVVLDPNNPFPPGSPLAIKTAQDGGTGVVSAKALPGALLVRAFSTMRAGDLAADAHRAGTPVALPIAADDPRAIAIGEQLVRDAGYEPVLVGGLASAKRFDMGSSTLGAKLYTAPELRAALGLPAN